MEDRAIAASPDDCYDSEAASVNLRKLRKIDSDLSITLNNPGLSARTRGHIGIEPLELAEEEEEEESTPMRSASIPEDTTKTENAL